MDRNGNVVTKNTWDASRGAAPNMFDPDDVVIKGIDTKDGNEAVLVDVTMRHDYSEILKLARNIIKNGQIHDVVLMKDGNKPIVTEGRRRVLAFRLIKQWVKEGNPEAQGLKEPLKVSCKTKRGDERTHMALMVSGNEHALADTPMSKARKALRLVNLGATVDDVAIDFGVTKQAVESWLKVAETHADVQAAVDKGILAFDGALALSSKPRDEQQAELHKMLDEAGYAPQISEDGWLLPRPDLKGPKLTGRVVRAAVNGAENPAPSKRQLNKILVAVKKEELDISEIEPEKLLKWVVGKVPTSQMKGFTKVLEG